MKRRRLTSLLLTGIMMFQTVSPALAVQTEAYAASAAAVSSHAHPVCGSSCSCASSHKSSDWTAWDGTTKMYDGNYYLTQDVELDSTMILDYGYSTNLCLNGHSITCEDTVFDIYSYRSLLITDCVGTGKVETTNADYTIKNNKYLSIWGGTILNSGEEGEAIAAIASYSNTNTFVCGGRVEGANAQAIYAYPGSKINVKGGTVHAGGAYDPAIGGHSNTSGVVGSMTVSGGSITMGNGGGSNYTVLDIQNGNFTMTGGYVGGSVYVPEGSADISGGTIDGFVDALEMTVTGGNMEIFSWSPAEINAGTFRGTCYLYGTDTVITGGDFSACDQTIVRGDTWICGGRFGQIRVGNAPLYLSGVPEIDVLMAEYPGMISAQNIDGSGSYGGSTIEVILGYPQSASDWEDGDIVVKNVTSDAVAAKFALAGVDAGVYSLVRSGSNLVLQVLPHGTWGSNVNWKLVNGTLTISGTGAMEEALSGEHYPWGQYLSEIREIVVEPGITEIPRYAFEYCEYARSIRLPETLQSLSLNAFNDCGSLNNLLLPASLASISGSSNTGRPSFIRCESLTDVYYLGTAEEWSGVANANQVMSSDSTMTMHCLEYHESTATCTEAGTQAHYRFDNTSVYGTYDTAKQPIAQPGVVPALGHDWMDGTPRTCAVCGAAEDGQPEVPSDMIASGTCGAQGDNLTWILTRDGTLIIRGTGKMDDYRYNGEDVPWAAYRNEIRAVSLGDGVTGIGSFAFLDCTLVTTVEIAAGITALNATAFKGCTGLTGFTVDSANTAYHAVDGVVFSADNSTVVAYPTGRAGAYVIPDGTTLGGGSWGSAFDYAQGLTKVTIPDGLQFESYGAFNECTNLTEVYCLGDFPFESVFKSFSTGSAVSWDGSHTFRGVTATVYYPEGNSTWTANKMVNMGGTLTYVPYTPGGSSAPDVSFAGGSGTANDPYQVETAEQLDHVRYHLDEHFIQTADIDLNGMDWTPIGTAAESFNGTYDGNGREIYNLTIDVTTTYAEADTHTYGLFGVCGSGSEIARLTVNCYIDVEYTDHIPMGESVSVGVVCGVTAGELWELVVNGSVNVLDRPTVGTMYVGGVAGRSSALITECINNATLQAGAEFVYVGGIVGSTTGNITHCETASYVMITVHGAMSVYVGGICGSSEYPLPGMMMIENCTNRACINARVGSDVGYVGGIVGYTTGGCTDCINANGEALDHELTGSASALYIAGIAAYSRDKMLRCTNTGAVRADTEACYGMGTITAAGICAVGTAAACTNRGNVSATGQNYAEAYGIATSVAYASAPAPSVNYGKVIAYSADQTGRAYGIAKEDFVSGAVNCGDVEATGMDAYASGIGGSTYVHQACNLGSVTARAKMYEAEAAGISTDADQFTMVANAGDIFAYDGLTTIYAAGITTNRVMSVGRNMYNAGDVTAEGFENAYAGGILADLYGVVTPTPEYVKNVYNVGKITASGESGNAYAGALVAHIDDSNDQIDLRNTAYLQNGYYLTGSAAAAVSNDTCGVALSGYEMTRQASFAGFDFSTVWSIDPEADYPFPVLQGLDIPMPKVDVDLNPPQSPGNDPQITSFWILGVEYTDFTTWENENHHVLLYPCNLTQPQNPEDIRVTVDAPGVTDVRVTLLEDYNPQYWSLVLIKDGREISHVLELAQPPHEGGDTIFTWVREDATGAYFATAERFCTGCGMLLEPSSMEVSNEILVEPSCTSEGLIRFSATAYYSETDDWPSDTGEAVIPATGHLPGAAVEENRVEPSAAADGSYDSVVYCQTCAAELSRETVVLPATGIDIVASGMLTDSITWTLDSNGTLTISGQGAIPDYDECSPWADYENILRICIEDGITRVGDHAIRDLHQLRSVTMADSVTELGNHAFTYCYELSEVHLSGNLTTIGPYAFYWDSALEEVEIPETVVSIGEFAFAVYGLTKIAIPASVTNIGCGAFTYSGRLTELTVAENNDTYTAMGNVLYTKDLIKTLVLCPTSVAVGEYTVADGVNSIASRAFQGCYDLTSVTIPTSVSDLGGNVFADCGSLKEIRFQGDAPAFQNNTFSGIEATVYYPAGNATWTEAVRQNYEGSITWVATGIDIVASGMLTDSITWTLDSDGTLTISGQGAIPDYDWYSPWGGYEDILRVRIEEGITRVGNHALRDIPQLRSVTMADSVTELGDYAFAYCYMLSDVRLSENLTGIGSFAFYWNEGMTELTIPEKVTSISYAAFAVMHELTSVTIPASVGYIGPEAFTSCSKLTNVAVAEENPVYTSRDNVVYTKDLKTLVLCPGGIAVGEYTVLDGVIRIEDRAFQGCFNLTSLTLPASVTELGESIVMDCGSLTEIRFRGDAPAFQDFTFSMATMTAYYPAGNATWTEYVRQNYEGSITWVPYSTAVASGRWGDIFWSWDGEGTLTISGEGAVPGINEFAGMDGSSEQPWAEYMQSITRVVLEEGITGIGQSAFMFHSQLAEVEFPSTLERIGVCAFAYCNSLRQVNLPESLKTLEAFAFDATGLTSVRIPAAVETMGMGVFEYCYNLAEIVIDAPIRVIPDKMFYYSQVLPGFEIPETVESIGQEAFGYCFALEDITIPAGVTAIGSRAFEACSGLKTITFEGDAPAIAEDAFDSTNNPVEATAYYPAGNATWTGAVRRNYGAESIVWVAVGGDPNIIASGYCGGEGDGTNLTWTLTTDGTLTVSGTGVMMDGNTTSWMPYLSSIKTVVIEEGVTTLGSNAFSSCRALERITLPGTLTAIGMAAFTSCTSLTDIEIPAGVRVIDAAAFSGCSSLSEILLPDGLESIYVSAFSNCTALQSITIPAGVTGIGNDVFRGCSALKRITFPGAAPYINGTAFFGVGTADAPATVYYPAGDSSWDGVANQNYGGTLTWVAFTETVASGTIGETLRWTLDSTGTLTISGEGAMPNFFWNFEDAPMGHLWFDYRDLVKKVVVEDGITRIGECAFSRHTNVTAVELPETLTEIGNYAFEDCIGLTEIQFPAGLTRICDYAFYNCDGLTTLDVPDLVYEIGQFAFCGCDNLVTVHVGSGISHLAPACFIDCPALETIWVNAPESQVGHDGTSFSNAEVIFLPEEPGEAEGFTWSYDEITHTLTISGSGESVLPIENAPWQEYVPQMRTLVIGDGIVELGAFAFDPGMLLEKIYLGKDVKRLSTDAFNTCMAGEAYFRGDQPEIMEAGVTQPFAGKPDAYIYYTAFKDWDEGAWTNCIFRAVPGIILEAGRFGTRYLRWVADDSGTLSVFGYDDLSATMTLADETTMPWSAWAEIICHVAIPAQVTEIGTGVFDSCTNLKTVYIDSCREDVTLAANAFDEDVTVRFKTCRTHSFDGGSTCTFCGADKCEALGHDYGEVRYHWGADYEFCTATRTCLTDANHTETVWAASIASVVSVPATCFQMGTTTYAAVFKETWTTTQMMSAMNIATIAHTPAAAVRENEVAATCTAAGSYDSVVYCSVCKTHEISRETIAVEKLEHTYDQQLVAPMYLKKAATCEQAAIYYYSCSACGAKGSETFVSGEALGHSYGTVSYTWSEDNWACTATRVCRRDASHTETASAHVTASMTRPSNCMEKGVDTYYAVFGESWATMQTKEVEDADFGAHIPADAVRENEAAATCTAAGSYDSVVYCSYCKVYEISRETITVEKLAHSFEPVVIEPTCEDPGLVGYTCTVCGYHYDEYELMPSHDYGAWITTKVPTFTEEGEEMRVCTRDAAHVEKRTIEKIPAVSYEMETGYVGVIERLPHDAYGMMVALYLNGRMLSCNIGGELVMTLPDLLQQADTLKVYYIDEGYQPVTHAGVIKLK